MYITGESTCPYHQNHVKDPREQMTQLEARRLESRRIPVGSMHYQSAYHADQLRVDGLDPSGAFLSQRLIRGEYREQELVLTKRVEVWKKSLKYETSFVAANIIGWPYWYLCGHSAATRYLPT